MDSLSFLQQVLIWIIPLLFAITLHEVAHGWIAFMLGDPTAKLLGRLTINPFKHIDLIGTILVPALLLLTIGFVFGWAKPVPITYENFKHRYRDIALVSAAGPLANLCMAILWAFVIKLGLMAGGGHPQAVGLPLALVYMGQVGVLINLTLFILNLLPILPLDGGRILSALLPGRLSWYYSKAEPYGFIILLLLLVTGVLGGIIWPLIQVARATLLASFGI